MDRKGIALTADTILALLFLLVITIALTSIYRTDTSDIAFKRLHYVSEDTLETLNKIGVLDEIATEWASNNTSAAAAIAEQYLPSMVPYNVGYRLTIDGQLITENARVSESDATVKTFSQRLLAGYGHGLPVLGTVARSLLTKIKAKTTSSFAYFGGFVGEGNLTRYITDIPSDASVQEIYFEGSINTSFDVIINSDNCDTITPSGGDPLMATTYNLSAGCVAAVTPGADNEFEFNFGNELINQSYVGGGYLKVTYGTDTLNLTPEVGTGRYWYPGIEGVINLFSAFYVPGNLTSLTMNLRFQSDYDLFVNIGNTTILSQPGGPGIQEVTLTDSNLTPILNYSAMSSETNPLRVWTNITATTGIGIADPILVTDVSGSMDNCSGIYDEEQLCTYWCCFRSLCLFQLSCPYEGTCNNRECGDCPWWAPSERYYEVVNQTSCISKLEIAKDAGQSFVEVVLNTTGNRVGLVSYETDVNSTHPLSNNEASLDAEIEGYTAGGWTCICCGINEATDMLVNQSDPTKYRAMVVMSDGIANTECSEQGTGDPAQDAIQAACEAYDDHGIIVYAVGFGEDVDETTLQSIAACGGGSYYYTNTTELEAIYREIAQEISAFSREAQTLTIIGDVNISTLYGYPDSYIEYVYDPIFIQPAYGEITLTYDTARFGGCIGYLDIPRNVTVVDAQVTSYSAAHWTDYVHVQDGASTTVYSLRDGKYGFDYLALGDPYIVQIPPELIPSGDTTQVEIGIGDTPMNPEGCSPDNRAILTINVGASTGYSHVFFTNIGCNWTIEFEDDTTINMAVPTNYTGSKTCTYMSSGLDYDDLDAIDDSVYRLLTSLDPDGDYKVDVKFDPGSINIISIDATGVRSLWGPADTKLILWT